jgi:GH25 family lysozyme M1 (1,4-beta-N-acetylmuramidase)/uncharacterized protein YjdB
MRDEKRDKKQEQLQDIDIQVEELLMDGEGLFDDEDSDTVTEDTLEFLSLDDETIGEYNRTHGADKEASVGKQSRVRYAEDDGADDDIEEDEEDIDDDDDIDYENMDDDDDIDYEIMDEEEEDEDDEDDYDDYEEGGVLVRLKYFLADMSTIDMVVAILGIVVLVGALVTSCLYVNARAQEKQVEAFAAVGDEIEGISVIGEGGLVAVSESAKLSGMIEEAEEEEQEETEEEEEDQDAIEVSLNLTSIQSDLKIKFVNKATGKLIGSVPFEVEVSGGKKTLSYKDEDKDGIIYQTGIAAGTYQVTVKPFEGDTYKQYKLPTQASSVNVTDTIAYKKVDVADEVKSESEVNVAAEDTAQQATAVESTLTDTVEWVESTKTAIGDGTDSYEEVSKSKIPDPWTVSSTYQKLVESGEPETQSEQQDEVTVSLDKDSLSLKTGESGTIKVSASNGGSYTADWSSSDTSVATVSDGNVTGVSKGTATITARVAAGSMIRELTCSVTVTEPANKDSDSGDGSNNSDNNGSNDNNNNNSDSSKDNNKETVYTKVSVSGTKEVAVGKTVTLQAVTEPKDGKVSWSSDNEKVAKVDSSGVVTGVAEGTAKITAVCKNENADNVSGSLEITVKKETSVDGSTKLKDQDGNQMYYLSSSGEYKEATYDDYAKRDKFFKKTTKASNYKYTGWQTIDGYVYFYDKDGNVVTGDQVIQGAKYSFGSDGRLSSNSGTMGIDVSKWNGSIDWNAVKNSGVSYVIIRCGYRGSSTGVLVEDPKFKSNIKGAKAAGLKVGAYFFSQAVNEVEAVEEASMAVSLCSGYGLNYPIFLDVEGSGGRGDAISRDTRTAVCKAFCATVQNSGFSAGIYANKTWFSEKINTASLTGYKIWLAQYASSPTYTATRYDMWQYSSTGKVSGISGKVDMNISYMSY